MPSSRRSISTCAPRSPAQTASRGTPQRLAVPAHRVIGCHRSGHPHTQNFFQPMAAIQTSMRIRWFARRHGEALLPDRQESGLQKVIGLLPEWRFLPSAFPSPAGLAACRTTARCVPWPADCAPRSIRCPVPPRARPNCVRGSLLRATVRASCTGREVTNRLFLSV